MTREEVQQVATYNGLRVLSNGVLVRLRPADDKEGSIYLPEERRHTLRSRVGEVLAVGEGLLVTKGKRAGEKDPLPVAVGDLVLFDPQPPSDEIVVGDETLWIVHVRNLHGIVEA